QSSLSIPACSRNHHLRCFRGIPKRMRLSVSQLLSDRSLQEHQQLHRQPFRVGSASGSGGLDQIVPQAGGDQGNILYLLPYTWSRQPLLGHTEHLYQSVTGSSALPLHHAKEPFAFQKLHDWCPRDNTYWLVCSL